MFEFARIMRNLFSTPISEEATPILEEPTPTLEDLYNAAKEGHIDVVKHLIANGAEVNKAKNSGATPLFVAAQEGHLEVVGHLIANGAEVNKAKNSGVTPLYIAAQNGHLEVVKHLIVKGAKVNTACDDGATPLYAAAFFGHLEVVEHLIVNGAEVDKAKNSGATPLYVAAQEGHIDVVGHLIVKGAKVNQAHDDGRTPLRTAAFFGHLEVVKHLIANDAKVNQACDDGATPLYVAAQNGHLDVVKVLLKKVGMNLADKLKLIKYFNEQPKRSDKVFLDICTLLVCSRYDIRDVHESFKGWNALHLAIQRDMRREDIEPLLTLYKKYSALDEKTGCLSQYTALHLAVRSNSLFVVKFLLKANVDIYAPAFVKRLEDKTAESEGRADVRQQIIVPGKLVTPFMFAVDTGAYKSAIELINHKDFNIRELLPKTLSSPLLHSNETNDARSLSPIFYAAKTDGADKVIEALLKKANTTEEIELLKSSTTNGNTPLHIAVEFSTKNAKFLLDKMDNPNLANIYGQTALHKACYLGKSKFISYAAQKNVSFSTLSNNGRGVFHFAANCESSNLIKYLYKNKGKLLINHGFEKRDRLDRTPLYYATPAVSEYIKKKINEGHKTLEKVSLPAQSMKFLCELPKNPIVYSVGRVLLSVACTVYLSKLTGLKTEFESLCKEFRDKKDDMTDEESAQFKNKVGKLLQACMLTPEQCDKLFPGGKVSQDAENLLWRRKVGVFLGALADTQINKSSNAKLIEILNEFKMPSILFPFLKTTKDDTVDPLRFSESCDTASNSPVFSASRAS